MLRADGSGTQRTRLMLSGPALAVIDGLAKEQDRGRAFDPRALVDPTAVRAALGAAGMRCHSLVARPEGDQPHIDVVAHFDDFASLQRSPLCGGGVEWQLHPTEQPGVLRLSVFPRGEAAWRNAFTAAHGLAERDPADRAELERMVDDLPQLPGPQLIMHWVFELPGDVVSHSQNTRRVGPRRVESIVTAADIASPRDLLRQLAPRFEVAFSAPQGELADLAGLPANAARPRSETPAAPAAPPPSAPDRRP